MENKHAESPDELLSVTPSAAIIGVHPQTLRQYEVAGLITCTRTRGNERRFRRGDLIAFRDNPQTTPAGEASPQAESAGVPTPAAAPPAPAGATTGAATAVTVAAAGGAAPAVACSAPGVHSNLVGADAHL